MSDSNDHVRLSSLVRVLEERLKRAREEGDEHGKAHLTAQLKDARQALADANNQSNIRE